MLVVALVVLGLASYRDLGLEAGLNGQRET
jgi:hypothetical protein